MSELLSEADIRKLVLAFYAQVREDELLAPVFATKIDADQWPKHMDHICDFWSSVLLKTQRFQGNPMAKHAQINGLTPALFTRWLDLFQKTAEDILSPDQAQHVSKTAHRIGQSLQMGLAFHHEKSGEPDHSFTEFGLRRPQE